MKLRPEFEVLDVYFQQLFYNLGLDREFLMSVRDHIRLCEHIDPTNDERNVITRTSYWLKKRAFFEPTVSIEKSSVDPERVPVGILTGQRELREMLESVIDVLCGANLVEEVKMFHDRVIVPALADRSKMLDYDQVGENSFRCKYKPMVELALLEIKAIATTPGLTDTMRKERIAEIFKMAGF